jgi:hypothetical protein
MKKTINKDTFLELLEEDGVITISEIPSKHDCSMSTVVIPFEGKMWECSYMCSYNDGILDNSFDLFEVEPKIVSVTKWVLVK